MSEVTQFLADREVAGQVAGALRNLDSELVAIRIEQSAQGKKDAEPMPHTDPPITYGERKQQLADKQERLLAEFEDVGDQVQEIIDLNRNPPNPTS